ncbi:MAG: cyclic nucleotide-binding domain-containing protein [Rubripirellula sp.]
MSWQEVLIDELVTPGKLVGHMSYVLLVASMMMRSMKWLRVLAMGSGLVAIAYGIFVLNDWVVIVWETIFVATNVLQLAYLEWENRAAKFSKHEATFFETVLFDVDRGKAKRVIQIGEQVLFEPGQTLLEQSVPVKNLHFIVEGNVQISQGDNQLGECSAGEFLGEISFLNGSPASATVKAKDEVRCLCFSHETLRATLEKHPDVLRAFETSFSRNLVNKLLKLNASESAG